MWGKKLELILNHWLMKKSIIVTKTDKYRLTKKSQL